MKSRITVILLWTVFLTGSPIAVSAEEGNSSSETTSEPVVVHLVGGRAFIAEIDRRSDEADLWLSWNRPTISLLRPIRWHRVASVDVEGQAFSGGALREAMLSLRQPRPGSRTTKSEAISIVREGGR